MAKTVAVLLLFIFALSPVTHGVHGQGANSSAGDQDSEKLSFLSMESPAWRISLTFTAISFIPDDRVRSQFFTRRDIIRKYASDPSNWGNPSDHFAGETLKDALWMNYVMLVQSLRDEDFTSASKYLGVIGHYIGDASDPMNVGEFTNETLKYASVYESVLDNTSANIFAVYGYAYTPNTRPSVSVNRSVQELIAYTRQFVDTVKGYIDAGDTEALSLTASEIAERALNVFLSILLKAIQDSGLADPWRVFARWGDLIFALLVAGSGIMFVLIVRNLKKRTVPRAEVEEESI